MIAWLQANAIRLIVWSGVVTALAMLLELDGFNRGITKLYDYQNDQLKNTVVIITKVGKVNDDELAQLQTDYNVLFAEYVRLHADAKRGGSGSLASAAASIDACRDSHRDDEAGSVPLRTAASVLDDVEDAVLAHLAAGDGEIIKFRRLASRDVRISNIK